jgi:DNA-binding response OmpR family regulator
MSDKIRVLIVEDHVALAENLFEFFAQPRYILDFAADGLTALHLLATYSYDVIVLDVMLPGISGFDICQRIRQDLQCETPIIFITAKDTIEDKVAGFARGGDDYLVKPFNLRELVLRIDALSRRRLLGNSALRAGSISFDPGTLKLRVDGGTSLSLSGTAARIAEILMRAYPRFVSYEELMDDLWPDSAHEMNTLRTHVYGLRKLLQETFGAALIKTLHGRGYRIAPPDEE